VSARGEGAGAVGERAPLALAMTMLTDIAAHQQGIVYADEARAVLDHVTDLAARLADAECDAAKWRECLASRKADEAAALDRKTEALRRLVARMEAPYDT
jgi:hypothetical protein